MSKGTVIGLGVGGAIVVLAGSFAIFAIGVAKEAGKMDDALKADLSRHLSLSEVKQELTGDAYTVSGSGAELNAVGPDHSFVVYSTHLTLKLTFDSDQRLTGYHLDRV